MLIQATLLQDSNTPEGYNCTATPLILSLKNGLAYYSKVFIRALFKMTPRPSAEWHLFVKCRYAECRYAQCRGTFNRAWRAQFQSSRIKYSVLDFLQVVKATLVVGKCIGDKESW